MQIRSTAAFPDVETSRLRFQSHQPYRQNNVNSVNVISTKHSFERNFLSLLGQYFHLFED